MFNLSSSSSKHLKVWYADDFGRYSSLNLYNAIMSTFNLIPSNGVSIDVALLFDLISTIWAGEDV